MVLTKPEIESELLPYRVSFFRYVSAFLFEKVEVKYAETFYEATRIYSHSNSDFKVIYDNYTDEQLYSTEPI